MYLNTSESSALQPENIQQKSCDWCKAHHTKCDKNAEGCKNCYRRGISCTYLIERKRRGPKTKVEHFMRYYESLYNTSSNQVSDIYATKGNTDCNDVGETYCNRKYFLDLNFNTQSSHNSNTSFVLNENMSYQMGSNMLPIFQNIHNPMLDTSCYSLSLSKAFTSIASVNSLITFTNTTVGTMTIDNEFSPIYSSLTRLSFENCTMLDQNGYPIYFD
jgi:hypothetical protein